QPAPRPAGFTTDRGFLLICAAALAVVLLIDWRLMATKAGRALQALRESPAVASNYGINVRAYTLLAFAMSGLYAGVAGALFASPYWIVTVVGGLRRRGGIVVFALLYELGGEYLPDLAKAIGIRYVAVRAGYFIAGLSGLLAILTLIFQPDGLGTITAPIGRWLKGERFELRS